MLIMGAYDEKSASHLLDSVLPTLRAEATIVVVGPAYRQTKIAIDGLAERAGVGASVRRDVDKCQVKIDGRCIIGFPLGDGSRICGVRPDLVVLVENFSIPRDAIEMIVMGCVPGVNPKFPAGDVVESNTVVPPRG